MKRIITLVALVGLFWFRMTLAGVQQINRYSVQYNSQGERVDYGGTNIYYEFYNCTITGSGELRGDVCGSLRGARRRPGRCKEKIR